MQTIACIFSFVFGAIVGSFINVVIFRLPGKGQSIIFPGSHCPKCEAPLHWYDNIPLLSYIALKGKCRSCKSPISPQYPVVELCMALLSLTLFQRFGLSFEFAYYFLFLGSLLAITFIDIQHQIIPDVISLPGIIVGFSGSFFCSQLSWQQSALGILIGGGLLYAIALGYYVLTKRDGMGGGDIKLLAMIGAFLGWQSLLFVVFASSLTGSIIGVSSIMLQGKDSRTRIPFGPFLALSAMTFLFFQQPIYTLWNLYLASMG